MAKAKYVCVIDGPDNIYTDCVLTAEGYTEGDCAVECHAQSPEECKYWIKQKDVSSMLWDREKEEDTDEGV